MPSSLQKEISTIWLIPLALIGLPFLLAAGGRLFLAAGAASLGELLVGWAQLYGRLPGFLFGSSSSALENTFLGYVVAGLLYSGIAFLLLLCGEFVSRKGGRSSSRGLK